MQKQNLIKDILKILHDYRHTYHQIFAKGLRYSLTEKIELIHFKSKQSEINSFWQVSQHLVFIFINNHSGIHAICTCPDFIFNTHPQITSISQRSYCSHIIAAFICLLTLLDTPKNHGIYNCNIKTYKNKNIRDLAVEYLYKILEIVKRRENSDTKKN